MTRIVIVATSAMTFLVACAAQEPTSRPTTTDTSQEGAPAGGESAPEAEASTRQPLVLVTHMTRPTVRMSLAAARRVLRGTSKD